MQGKFFCCLFVIIINVVFGLATAAVFVWLENLALAYCTFLSPLFGLNSLYRCWHWTCCTITGSIFCFTRYVGCGGFILCTTATNMWMLQQEQDTTLLILCCVKFLRLLPLSFMPSLFFAECWAYWTMPILNFVVG